MLTPDIVHVHMLGDLPEGFTHPEAPVGRENSQGHALDPHLPDIGLYLFVGGEAIGDLAVADLPAAWNERMLRDLGSAPPDDAQGCLQDIHWSGGSFGYFPTYTLGNLYAAQFFARAQTELGDLEEQFRRGEFLPLKEWLNQKIHREGQRNRAVDLVAAVTGEPLNPAYLLRHLRKKLGTLYGV